VANYLSRSQVHKQLFGNALLDLAMQEDQHGKSVEIALGGGCLALD